MTPGELWRRIWYLVNRGRLERELAEEMAAHRESMEDRRRFGNPLTLREASRDAWGWGWLDRGWQDLRDGIRVLRRAPGFAMSAWLILTVGIGLNLTFFHLLNVTALQAPAIRDSDTLVRFSRQGPSFFSSGLPYPATRFIRQHNEVLSAVLTRHRTEVVWEGESLNASYVSANWFDQMGYGAATGRVFTEQLDENANAPAAVVLSHQLWRTRFGSDPDIGGREVRLNGRVATVVGVAPASFPDADLDNPQLWLLTHQIDYFEPGTTFADDWRGHSTELYGRLRPGVSPAAAKEGLRPALAALARARPQEFKPDQWLEPATASDRFRVSHDRRQLWSVAALVGGLTVLVLLVASANLGNLVLSHAIGRLREFSVRAALGASRWRILRHILVECGLLAAAGAAGGMVVGHASARALASITELPPYLDFAPDWRLLLAAAAVALVAMVAFGLIPAWMVSRRDLIRALKDGGQQTSAGLARARFRLALVAAQIVGCCALLIVAGAMVRSLQDLLAADPGFEFDRVAVLDPSPVRYGIRGEAVRGYWSDVKQIVAASPDVDALALVYPEPLGDTRQLSGYDGVLLRVTVMHVEPSFFSVLEIPLIAGRTFEAGEAEAPVVIISRRLALAMYGTLDVVGQPFPRTKPDRTIVGVAGDASVIQVRAPDGAEEYMPIASAQYGDVVLVARSRTDPKMLVAPLREAARAADARVLPMTRLLTAEFEKKLRAPRLASAIAGGVAALVLTLACVGIFGVVAYAVKVRTKEIGIRRALGADTMRVFGAVLPPLAWPLALGMLLGTAVGVGATRVLSGEPFVLAVADPTAPVVALTLFAVAALLAAVLPARRALRVNPVAALRDE